jgi:hypothetical protein
MITSARIKDLQELEGMAWITCLRHPAIRKLTRQALLAATEADLGKIAAQVAAGRVKEPDKTGIRAGKIISKRKVARHFILDIAEGRISWRRDQGNIDAEALTDGIYVIRTPVPADVLDAAGAVAAYQDLARLERDFRHIKAEDLDLRPIWHRLEDRVKAHVLICLLACYLTWHLPPRPPPRPAPANNPSAASAT